MKHGELLLNAQINIAVLIEALLDDFALVLTAFTDGFHFELHLDRSRQYSVRKSKGQARQTYLFA